MDPVLLCERDEGIATLTLNRPKVRNALSEELRERLREQVAELDADPTVDVIVLTGADPAFCAGVDTRELGGGPAEAANIGPLAGPFLSSRTPLIGGINGAAYTGGLELALSCHFLIASERATFADTHAKLGLMPGWGLSVLLAEAVGVRRARQVSVTSAPIDAQTALSWGLVNRVVPHHQLLAVCSEVGRLIRANDSSAVQRVSRLYDEQAQERNAHAWRLEAASWSGSAPRPT